MNDLPSREKARMMIDPKNLKLMDPDLRYRSLMSEMCLPVLEAWASGRLVDREAIANQDQVPNWWMERDVHAILGAKLGSIEAGWRYFCGLVDVAIVAAIGDTPSTITSADWFNRDDNI